MSSTVAYQETPNNFTDVGQKIKGSQVVSVRTFSGAEPTSVPDFVGQLAICNDPVAGRPLIFMGTLSGTGTAKGWDLINQSGGGGGLPDYVVVENSDNDFSVYDQTIQGAQIACVTYGVQPASLEPIKGSGHFYIKVSDTNAPEMFMAVTVGSKLEWRSVSVKHEIDPARIPFKDEANEFSNLDQTIGGHPIATFWSGAQSPVDAGIAPAKAGQIFMQVSESAPDKKAHFWFSKQGASSTKFVWEYLDASGSGTIPSTVALTDKVNNFQVYEQKISDAQIISFVDGKGRTPDETHYPASYDGQFYICTKTLSTGNKDTSIWVAEGNTWIPLLGGLVNVFASLHDTNIFHNPTQFLGDPKDVRMISGNRVKRGTQNPEEDVNWKAEIEGETTIFINTSTTPSKTSIWNAIKVNPSTSNAGEWVCIWADDHVNPVGEIAYQDKINIFVPGQMIGEGSSIGNIAVARHGTGSPLVNKLPPFVCGDIYIQLDSGASGSERHVWVGTEEADSTSWIKIHGEDMPLPDSLAYVDKENFFVPGQKIGTSLESVELAGARVGESPPGGKLIPFSVGELYVQKIRDSVEYTVYIATIANNSASWKVVYDSTATPEGLLQRVSELEQAQVGDDARFAELETDFNKGFQDLEGDVNGLISDFDIEKNKLNSLSDVVNALETKSVDWDKAKDLVNSLVTRVEELERKLEETSAKAQWSEDCLTTINTGSHSPLGHQAVTHSGGLYIQNLGGSSRQIWMGVKPDTQFDGSDWIKLQYSES